MPDDTLAKAAFVAWHMQIRGYGRAAAEDEWENTSWPEGRAERWSAIARAVLEAAGVKEMAELLGWYREEQERERRYCLRFGMRESCEGCALSPCDTVEKIERIRAALQRAGKEGNLCP